MYPSVPSGYLLTGAEAAQATVKGSKITKPPRICRATPDSAVHAQREHVTCLARRGAHYQLIVKRNQPCLHTPLAALPRRDVPKAYDKAERGHGRTNGAPSKSPR